MTAAREWAARAAKQRLQASEAHVEYLRRYLESEEAAVAHHEHEVERLERLARR
jgi:hypothetical protein